MNEEAISVVAVLQQRWMKAFGTRDVEGLVDLYADECLLFGSNAALTSGRPAVRAYFGALPKAPLRAAFGAQSVRRLAPTVVVSAGWVDFTVGDAAPLAYRISLTIVRKVGDWKIASQHASPVPIS
jgi:uncharacterized protein (TIGR02246 family)